MPASGISSELSAHQMAPAGAIAHSRAHLSPCASSLRLLQCGASAGHVAVYNVVVMVVGNRRAPGATILGGRAQVHHLPTTTFVSHRRVVYFVMGGPVDSVRDGVLPEG